MSLRVHERMGSPSHIRFQGVIQIHPRWAPSRAMFNVSANRILVAWIFFSLPFISGHSASSQPEEVIFDHLSVEQGLSNATVNAIARDTSGYIWFGTVDGLCRYDGYSMKVFRHSSSDTTSIADNAIAMHCIYVDRTGALWIGTYSGGLDRFEPSTERFIHYRNAPSNPRSLSNNNVRAIFEDSSGSLWVGTFGGGVCYLDRERKEFRTFVHDSSSANSLIDNFVRAIYADHTGALWLGSKTGGVNRIDPLRQTVTQFLHDPRNPATISGGEVWSIIEDGSHSLWVATDQGLNEYNFATGLFTRYTHATENELGVNFVVSLCEDNMGRLWIGTLKNGITLLNLRTREFSHLAHQPSDPTTLSSDQIRTIHSDTTDMPQGQQANVWVGTVGGGVSKLNTAVKKFKHYRHSPSSPYALGRGSVQSLIQNRAGSILVGTSESGVHVLDRASGRFTTFRHGISNDFVSALLEGRNSLLWIGTWGGGLTRLDPLRNTSANLRHIDANPTSISGNRIFSLLEDHDENLWVAVAGGGLDRYDGKRGEFFHYTHDPDNPNSISSNQTTMLIEGSNHMLWIGTEGGGLCKLDPSSGTFARFMNDPLNPASLSNDRVYALYEDEVGGLWVATAEGLNRMKSEDGRFEHYFKQNGLPSDYIRGIIGDHDGHLWLMTPSGLSCLTIKTRSFRHFDARDGLHGNELNGSCFRNSAGEIFIGGSDGFSIFHPSMIVENQHAPPIVLTDLNIFEQPARLDTSISTITKVVLSYRDDHFSFGFAALDYADPAKNTYEYMMEGFDKEWLQSGTRRFAYFTNLDPGEYVFKVRGTNNDGLWSHSVKSVAVVITPPFWKTWWFRFSIAVTIIGVLAAAYNYRVTKLLEMERMRIRIASDLHDDIGSNLSSIALITDMVRKGLGSDQPEHRQLLDVSHAARRTADALKDIVWIINPEHDKVDDMALRMKDAASKLLAGTDYIFHGDTREQSTILDMDFRRHVLLIYKEALNNIAKYAHASHVDISLQQANRLLCLRITDNGIGFDEATVQMGNGLKNLRARAKKIGGSLSIKSTPGNGTVVELQAKIP